MQEKNIPANGVMEKYKKVKNIITLLMLLKEVFTIGKIISIV